MPIHRPRCRRELDRPRAVRAPPPNQYILRWCPRVLQFAPNRRPRLPLPHFCARRRCRSRRRVSPISISRRRPLWKRSESRSLRQHRPIEIILIRDRQNAVAKRDRLQFIRRSLLPSKRRDAAGKNIDQHRMLDSGVLDSQVDGDRRKNIAGLAEGGKPIGHNRLACLRAKAVRQKGCGLFQVKGGNVRLRDSRSKGQSGCPKKGRWCFEGNSKPGAE